MIESIGCMITCAIAMPVFLPRAASACANDSLRLALSSATMAGISPTRIASSCALSALSGPYGVWIQKRAI
ncbi:MAG: hypothetical protein E6K53_17180 [Gammaproteobacteria bacterium]|nr:MAG: hypothetical protein E6K53_17180 [Gammaproteobacteria bacterium]